jgi:hypothetical protein
MWIHAGHSAQASVTFAVSDTDDLPRSATVKPVGVDDGGKTSRITKRPEWGSINNQQRKYP